MRQDLMPYFWLPFYRAMIERCGFDADIEAFDAAGGDRGDAAAISDGFLDELTAVGYASEVQAGSSATPPPAPSRRASARSREATSARRSGAAAAWRGVQRGGSPRARRTTNSRRSAQD